MVISNVKITVNGLEGITDEDGSLTFEVATGTYLWTASKEGYKPQCNSITIIENVDVEIPVFMEKMEMLNVIVKKYRNEEIGKREVIVEYYKLFAGRVCTEEDITRELKVWSDVMPIQFYTIWFIYNLSEVFN